MNNLTLDDFDKKILQLLEKDARKPFSMLATQVGISNTMVHQRVMRLRNMGILKGFTTSLDDKKLGYEWSTFTGIVLKEDSDSKAVIEALKQIPEVIECYFITGQYTLYTRIVARSNEQMRAILYDKIDTIPGVLRTESMIDFGCAFRRNVPV